ncbi:MAG: phosphatidate cytidylyltransferase [Acidimicrobiia bacterium]
MTHLSHLIPVPWSTMADERSDNNASSFDDWLAEEAGPATDPYAPPADGDETDEIDTIDDAVFRPETGPPGDESTAEDPEPAPDADEEVVDPTDTAGIITVPTDDEPFDPDAVFEFEAYVGDDEPDTGEIEIVAPDDEVAGIAASFGDLWADEDGGESPFDDAVDPAAVPYGTADAPDDDAGADDFGFAEETIFYGSTREHAGLAAAIAAAEAEDTEQVALVAEIPGLESSVVGFDDVVKAEGHRRVRARATGDLISRVITGIILILALAASLVWRPALVVFAIVVFVLAAGEFYTALARSGRRPISLFGFAGIVAASLGAFWWSAAAIPIAFLIATVLLLMFYAVVPDKEDPLANLALTTTVMVWAGLGSFAMLIANADAYETLIIGVVVVVAGADIAAFFVGRSIGRTHFAPWVSPNKTVEGLVAGTLVAVGLGAMLHYFEPFELTSGLVIGMVAAVMTPLGDLAMSAAKRALGLKDMGSVLPGHGGFFDRIDGLLFAIPAAWAVLMFAGLL